MSNETTYFPQYGRVALYGIIFFRVLFLVEICHLIIDRAGGKIEKQIIHPGLFTFKLRKIIMPGQNFKKEYWKKNLQYLAVLLGIWFIVSYGFSILLVDLLDNIKICGFKLGFWFSQQGSIFIFVILIFIYVRLMNKLDKKYHVEEKEAQE